MPDSFGVYDDMKVWEYLDFFARCYGIPADRRRRMIGDLLDLVDLGPKRDTYVQGLSRGMQQRLCLAHTLVHDPQVLLLDEPASGLDPRARVELRELLRELRSAGQDDPRLLAHPPRARGAVHLGRDHRPRARCSRRAGSPTSSAGSGSGRCSAPGSSATRTGSTRRAPGSQAQPDVVTADLLEDGHDRDRVPRRRRGLGAAARATPSARASGSRRSPGPRATSRSCSSR